MGEHHHDNDKNEHHLLGEIIHKLDLILHNQKHIMGTQTELAAELTALKAENDTNNARIIQKISDLEAAIVAAGNTTPEVDAALAALKDSVKGGDSIGV